MGLHEFINCWKGQNAIVLVNDPQITLLQGHLAAKKLFQGIALGKTLRYLHASRGDMLRWQSRLYAGEWCNGNTPVFGTVILGSSPSSPATIFVMKISLFQFNNAVLA